jgi:hypothetical protein
MKLNRSPHMLALALLALVGCSQEPVRRRRDAGPTPFFWDGGTDARYTARDAHGPDASASSWMMALGADCSLGTGNAFGFSGEVGEYISAGLSWRESSREGWSAALVEEDMRQAMNLDAPGWLFDFVTPIATPLSPGEYVSAQLPRSAESGRPGLHVYGQGRGCTQVAGSFIVYESEFVDGVVRRFRASFEQDCGTGVLVGCVRFVAP